MSGFSGDIRDIIKAVNKIGIKDERLDLTLQVYLWRLKKNLGSYLAVTGAPAAVIFTDTIGETVPEVRWAACAGFEVFGIALDAEKNKNAKQLPCDISAAGSRMRALVIATNEELAIARVAYSLLKEKNGVLS
jgi:acetate kinase